MALVRDLIEWISTPQGALAYHLVTLFAIQMIAGLAVGHWRRQRDRDAIRLLTMALGLFLARAALMVLAVAAAADLISSTIFLPPLERFLQFVTSLLIIWALLPVLEDRHPASTVLLVAGALIAAGAYAASASSWLNAAGGATAYNSTRQARLWDLSTAALLGLALLGALVRRTRDWSWLVCLLALWLAGHVLQLSVPIAERHWPSWVRLANLASLPLLAALVYRRALALAYSGASRGPRESDAGD